MGRRDGAVMTALASQKSGSGAILGVDAICGLSLLLVLVLAPRGFFPGTPVFPSLLKKHHQIPVRSGECPHTVKCI